MIHCEKRIHPAGTSADFRGTGAASLIGPYQYIYTSPKGKISMIELDNYWKKEPNELEIYCLSGDLFDDVERFTSRIEVEVRIKELLD